VTQHQTHTAETHEREIERERMRERDERRKEWERGGGKHAQVVSDLMRSMSSCVNDSLFLCVCVCVMRCDCDCDCDCDA